MVDLSIILPVYNEVNTIELVLKEWKKELDEHRLTYNFVICEDGSKDGTKELLKSLKNKYRLVLSQKDKRRGYGGAVLDGINESNSTHILCIDSDGQCDAKDFSKFWKNKKTNEVLMGWRVARQDAIQRKIFSRLFMFAFKILFPTFQHDPSAPFVLFEKKLIKPQIKYLTYLKEGFWWGFVGACYKKKIVINELPINHRERIDGNTQVYLLQKIPSIAFRNFIGLIKLKLSS